MNFNSNIRDKCERLFAMAINFLLALSSDIQLNLESSCRPKWSKKKFLWAKNSFKAWSVSRRALVWNWFASSCKWFRNLHYTIVKNYKVRIICRRKLTWIWIKSKPKKTVEYLFIWKSHQENNLHVWNWHCGCLWLLCRHAVFSRGKKIIFKNKTIHNGTWKPPQHRGLYT